MGQPPGQPPISVNLRNVSRSLTIWFSQLFGDVVPVPEGLCQTVTRQYRHADLVIHEFNFPPPASPQIPIGIPRGKLNRRPPPCAPPGG